MKIHLHQNITNNTFHGKYSGFVDSGFVKNYDELVIGQEEQRRQIQDALNRQSYEEFRAYAEQQYPDNPDQQAILIRQLQEQHYYQYMQQVRFLINE